MRFEGSSEVPQSDAPTLYSLVLIVISYVGAFMPFQDFLTQGQTNKASANCPSCRRDVLEKTLVQPA
jgi:hypothetical protein